MAAKAPKKDKIKISAFLKAETLPRVKREAKASGISMTDYVSDSVEQRLSAIERKRKQRKVA